MRIVDTHCHVGLHKYEPVEFLLHHMERAGVEGAVMIQYMGNADNAYLLECLKAHPGKLSGVMIVAPDDEGTRMRAWAEQGIGGIRLLANSRARAADPLAQWRAAAELGLVVSAFSNPEILLGDEFSEVVEKFPDLQIVIEHLGGVSVGAQPPYADYRQVFALARYPNLTIKLPGFGEFCELPCPFEEVAPLAEMALEAFGPQRVMWGSDYPPVSSREGYGNALSFPMDYFAGLSETEREWIFSRTALSLWKF